MDRVTVAVADAFEGVNGGEKVGHVAAENQAIGGGPSAMARAHHIAGAGHGAWPAGPTL